MFHFCASFLSSLASEAVLLSRLRSKHARQIYPSLGQKLTLSAALNWPHSRGTATALPMGAFGLSAFFFSFLSSIFFHEDTASFLLLLSLGTFGMVFISWFFLQIIPHPSYSALPTSRSLSESQQLHRTKSHESRHSAGPTKEPGRLIPTSGRVAAKHFSTPETDTPLVPEADDEVSSLLSSKSVSENGGQERVTEDVSQHIDVRGLALLTRADFWQILIVFGLTTGIGLMTIKYEYLSFLWRPGD